MPTVLTGKHRALDRPGTRVATYVPERQPQVDPERKLHAAGILPEEIDAGARQLLAQARGHQLAETRKRWARAKSRSPPP